MTQSFAYILNQRPFRDSSVLLDIFSEDNGRICCVARPAKKRGKVIKGNLEPFRYLKLQWIGKGDVQTLIEADERGRHNIPSSEMMLGLYLNELLLLLTRQHVALPELFSAYKYTLHKLSDPLINKQLVMRFELYLLHSLGHSIQLPITGKKGDSSNTQIDGAISDKVGYRFTDDEGLVRISENSDNGIQNGNQKLSGQAIITESLLSAIEDLSDMEETQWRQLRQFLDSVFNQLAPRTIHSRRLLSFN